MLNSEFPPRQNEKACSEAEQKSLLPSPRPLLSQTCLLSTDPSAMANRWVGASYLGSWGQGCLSQPLLRPSCRTYHVLQSRAELSWNSLGGQGPRATLAPRATAVGASYRHRLYLAPRLSDSPINSSAASPAFFRASVSLAPDLAVPVGTASLQNKQQNQYFFHQGRCRVCGL